jgi:hypothetical protein
MKCNSCGLEITPENEVCEDTVNDLISQVDYFGLESMTENKQTYLEGHPICNNCIK